MTGAQLRGSFLEFFREKQHTIVASDSLVPAGDPTLLFTGAGMNQFKENFLGIRRDLKRAASCQTCFRAGDLDQVGRTPAHLSFFEMLGNFSFGDYFKEEACAYAWEFLTRRLKIPAGRMQVSVYEQDAEAARIWKETIGLAPDRIVRMGPKDNFWPSNAPADGPNGPCGPCSEIYFDTGCCTIGKICPDPARCSPACGCGRFVEVWNLVFTQYERRDGGKLADLPQKNIDTGMGLERLAAVMQGKASVFETDLFAPIVRAVETLAGGGEAPAIRAIADHVRALTFLIRDGVMPGNEGRGYVLRMLLRRAARHGRRLGIAGPFLDRLVPAVVEAMGAGYPDLAGRAGRIAEVIRTEEERFDRTLEEKLPILRQTVERLGPGGVFPADAAARFYDTHGLSLEEIAESCRAAGVTPPPPADFEAALDQLQAASRAGSAFAGDVFAKDAARELVAGLKQTTRFIGYDRLSAAGRVVALLRGEKLEPSVKSAGPVGVILDATPFYGEAGGQVGDAGELTGPSGRLRVLDTQWIGATLLHRAELLEGKIAVGEQVTASVDPVRREQVARNHTATHLLHAALRKVLGEHVTQAGSLVAPDHLRFDFTHGRGLPAGERQSVEDLVNQWIAGHFPVRTDTMTMAQAREAGAMALFGEKYGDSVRVVSIGTVSKELCGGTHLHASDGVGLLTIVEEGSVAAGTRRVKALCAESALEGLEGQRLRQAEELERLIQATAELESCWKGLGGKVPAPLPKRGGAPAAGERSLAGYRAEFLRQAELLEQLKRRQKGAQRGIRERESAAARDKAGELTGETIGPWPVYLTQFSDPMDHAALRAFGDGVRKKEPSAVFFLADPRGFFVAGTGGRPEARALVRIATDLAGGSGGGRPELVQGKLADPGKFSEVKREQKRFIQEQAKAS